MQQRGSERDRESVRETEGQRDIGTDKQRETQTHTNAEGQTCRDRESERENLSS